MIIDFILIRNQFLFLKQHFMNRNNSLSKSVKTILIFNFFLSKKKQPRNQTNQFYSKAFPIEMYKHVQKKPKSNQKNYHYYIHIYNKKLNYFLFCDKTICIYEFSKLISNFFRVFSFIFLVSFFINNIDKGIFFRKKKDYFIPKFFIF